MFISAKPTTSFSTTSRVLFDPAANDAGGDRRGLPEVGAVFDVSPHPQHPRDAHLVSHAQRDHRHHARHIQNQRGTTYRTYFYASLK